ncbi:hypothetical protein BC829DRAFT_417221 [Chytridium lagenaria]|nr:hypothetical protein BC829DRAFT_417221 [Chytridium lagenaria]
MGVGSLRVWNRTFAKAETLTNEFGGIPIEGGVEGWRDVEISGWIMQILEALRARRTEVLLGLDAVNAEEREVKWRGGGKVNGLEFSTRRKEFICRDCCHAFHQKARLFAGIVGQLKHSPFPSHNEVSCNHVHEMLSKSGGWVILSIDSRKVIQKSSCQHYILFVPQASVYVIERFGKFDRILEPGLSFLVPVIDRIKYVQSLKENTVEIPTQSAITQETSRWKLTVSLLQNEDPYKASYEFKTLIAVTNLRNHDGIYDKLRYEIRDIHPPENVVAAMHQQVSAERKKRAEILESEGASTKQSMILESEAKKAEQINQAEGENRSILLKAEATAVAIERVAEAIRKNGAAGQDAISLTVAEKYIDAFGNIAKQGTTVVVPSNVSDAKPELIVDSTKSDESRNTPRHLSHSHTTPAAMITNPALLRTARTIPAAASHSLAVPYAHLAVTPFEMVSPPSRSGYSHIPYGEVWVVQRGGSARVLTEGTHILLPFVDKVKAIKNSHIISVGIVSPTIKSADGASVNAYAVVYFKVTDYIKSNQADSERAAAKVVKRLLEQEVPALSVGSSAVLSESSSKILSDKISAALKAKTDDYGLEVVLSPPLPTSRQAPCLDPPLLLPEQSGHNLANDYWADVITPPFFQKRKFGNEKEVVTPAVVSLEWSIPSPQTTTTLTRFPALPPMFPPLARLLPPPTKL